MSIIGKRAVRPLATLAAMATLATGLTCMSNPVGTPAAHAAEPSPTYTTARIVKKADGTGHGTAAQTFVNSKNGFAPGDDSPTDGVVASGDTVEYSLTLDFSAARKRVVRVGFDLSQAPYLEPTDGGGFCQTGQLVSTKKNSDGSCSYTVPAGGVETMTQTLYLKAKDTGGIARKGQVPKFTVSREGADGASATYRSDELTVVSAPAADLIIDNGGNPADGQARKERHETWTDKGTIDGYFTIRADPLTYPGHSTTKGASTMIPWRTTVDVSRFPSDTVWSQGGQTLKASNGRLTVSSSDGRPVDLNYRVQASTSDMRNLQKGDVKYYDVRLLPDKTIFSVDGGALNLGTGGEPGWNAGRDSSTYGSSTGARSGYPYSNNDWSRAIIERPEHPDGFIFRKDLERPNTEGKTMFEKENQNFSDARSSFNIYHEDELEITKEDTVAQNTQVRTILTMRAANMTAGLSPSIQDNWDSSQLRWDGGLEVVQGDRPINGYTFQWTDKSGGAWRTGLPSAADAAKVSKVRVSFRAGSFAVGGNADDVYVKFITRAIADTSKNNVRAKDTMYAWWSNDIYWYMSNWVWIAEPARPKATLGMALKAYAGDGDDEADAESLMPGNRVEYTVSPKMASVSMAGLGMLPTITVRKPAGLFNPTCDDQYWQMRVDGDNLVFTPILGKTAPELDHSGDADFPDLHFGGTVSNLASGTVSATATMSVAIDGRDAVKAQTVASNTASASFAMSDAETNSGIMRARTAKTELGDPLVWSFNVYSRNKRARNGTVSTMLLLPAAGDDKYEQEKLDEYDRGYSKFHGSYRLDSPVAVDGGNSTSTTVYYSTTTGKTTDNPNDYTWTTWDRLTDADKGHVTAIRLVSAITTQNKNDYVSAASGTIALTPSGNTKDDRYVLWLGRNYYSDAAGKPAGSQPWPDVTTVAAGSVSGTVWWDRDENTLIGDGEERIEGVVVSLDRKDDSGNWKTAKTARTDKNGRYEFTLLHSGTYRTTVKRSKGVTTGDGVQTQVRTYYGKLENVTNTRSWLTRIKSAARDTSDDIHLGVGVDQTGVDYGYTRPDPKATVDKTVTGTSCSGAKCAIGWDVKVRNEGKTTKRAPSVPPLTTFSGGEQHSLALDADGHLWTWGRARFENLGTNHETLVTAPIEIKPETTFTQVAAGNCDSYAIDADGHLWAWGFNSYGQIGDGTTTNRWNPVKISPQRTFTQVTADQDVAFALDGDGHLWAWGDNEYGQLGDGTTIQRHAPVQVKSDRMFTQISTNSAFSLALDADGHLWAWGYNGDGRLGDGTTTSRSTPVEIKPETTFSQIATDGTASLALDADGHLWAWGLNSNGQLGDGSTTNRLKPVKIKPETIFTQVAAGYNHSLALDTDGHLWAWGANYLGQLGDGTTTERHTPVEIGPGTAYVQIGAGSSFSLALDKNGNIWTWGRNSDGELCDGTTTNRSTPVLVSGNHTWKSGVQLLTDDSADSSGTSRFDVSSVVSDRMSSDVHDVTASAGTVSIETGGARQVATSGDHKFVLTNEGLLYAWGDNQYGQLGFAPDISNSATPANQAKPTVVDGAWSKVAAGGKHSAAIRTNGRLYVTGWNGSGQLGTGDKDNRTGWTAVATDRKFTDVACGNDFTIAVASDGTVWYTGLGAVKWTRMSGIAGATQVSAFMDSWAVLTAGNVYYSVRHTATPTAAGLAGCIQVAAGYGNAYALKPDGTVWAAAAGLNVGQLRNITRISGGYQTLYAIDANQRLWSMGWNGDGQLANGKTGNGVYWTNGDASKADMSATPVDTGITASDVSGGDRDMLAISGKVMIAGFDPYGDGKTGGARSTGLKGMVTSTDPTAVPVSPTSETTVDGMTTRTYNLPYAIEPGGYVIYHFTGTVDRDVADLSGKSQAERDAWTKEHTKTILNQAWFDSEHTPYSGTPHADGKATPDRPDATKLNSNTDDVTGNPTCRTDSDYTEEGRQHWFSTSDEDSCDQVGVIVEPRAYWGGLRKTGSISGIYWEDTNRNGIREDGETKRLAGQTVILYDENGGQVATTKTNADGAYTFDHLDADGDRYVVQFSRVSGQDFTTPDANDKDKANDASSTDSDASIGEDDYGESTVTVTLTQQDPKKEHVDAGVMPRTLLAGMPHTGMGLLLPTLMLASIIGLAAAIVLLGKDRK